MIVISDKVTQTTVVEIEETAIFQLELSENIDVMLSIQIHQLPKFVNTRLKITIINGGMLSFKVLDLSSLYIYIYIYGRTFSRNSDLPINENIQFASG